MTASDHFVVVGRILLLGCALTLGCASSGSRGSHATHSSSSIAADFDSTLAVAAFDSTWSIINRTHFDRSFGGLDWNGVREELRPEAEAATSTDELRRIQREMIGRLGLSHFGVIPGSIADAIEPEDGGDHTHGDADTGIEVRVDDEAKAVVWRVRPDSPAEAAGVKPGWTLEVIGEHEVADYATRIAEAFEGAEYSMRLIRAATIRLEGAAGSSVEVSLLDGSGETRAMTLERQAIPGPKNKFGNLPPLHVDFHDELREWRGQRIGIIGFNVWLIPQARPFDLAVDRYRDADGIVIDLRGNLGGIAGMAMGISGHFLTERSSLGTMTTRQNALEIRANPRLTNAAGQRVKPFDGPVAILVDAASMSTSEIFAGGLQSLRRARVFGQRTPGAALPSALTRLPNGDVLQHAFADFVGPDGVRLEGRGVIPDVVAPVRRGDLLEGRDAPLEAAMEWIVSQP